MRLILIAFLLVAATPVAAQPLVFVDADATGANDGSSWADAFADLQDALAVAEAGDEVWVAEGTYRPSDSEPADRDASFVLVSGTALYGGFDGTETSLDQRDPEANETVLSGDLGVPDDETDNAFHVVTASGVDDSTVLDGFTVTAGFGNGANPRNRGAGVYALDGSPVIRNCRIVENRVRQTDGNGGGGGAFFGRASRPQFERVVFERNGENAIGGGLWLQGDFVANRVGGEEATRAQQEREMERGAVSAAPLRPVRSGERPVVLREVTFIGNTGSFGGGADISILPEVALVDVVFERNVAFNARGGLSLDRVEADLVNVGFYGNTIEPVSTFDSSGGLLTFGVTFTMTNVAFVGNTARSGGALNQAGGASVLTNVVFVGNEAEGGGAIRTVIKGATLGRSTILWQNEADEIEQNSSDVTFRRSLIEGGCPPDVTCENLLNADPRFVRDPDPGPDGTWGTPDDDYGDLRLRTGSSALDFGLAEFLPSDTFDLDEDGDTAEPLPLDLAGEVRVQGGEVDLGAYEGGVTVAAEEQPSVSDVSLDIYPNPARGAVTVIFSLSRAQTVEVSLFDVLGRRVAVVPKGLPAARHTLHLETASLPSGVYVLRLRGETVSRMRRLVVLR